MEQDTRKSSIGDRWSAARPTKTVVFWSCMASAVVTMIIGFTWGGWVTGGTARRMAEAQGEGAVVERLAAICVEGFNGDSTKIQKLAELKEISDWQQAEYVMKHGWATMPGQKEPERDVASECARRLLLVRQ